ncbi:type ii secretion system integral membrane subunit [Rhodococcus sp. ABRD24]|uniref:type II secretion system F family protein n=1 Tax=Rhodococcus sp. ABRD24 TaxID=2507582 RepID=UPI00103CD1AC|nr:type II secretion system F family protein [Rhodococcus sp. ABRD24]QBJ97015.1 type ii secretion system integral membrane subunit [Rhodococcus sp. ABRD24]
MTASLLLLSTALVMTPSCSARKRLRTALSADSARRGVASVPWRRLSLFDVALVGCVPLLLVGAIAPAVAAAIAFATLRGRQRRRRAATLRDAARRAVLAGLDVVIGELRVGAHPAVACEAAAEECGGAVADVFRGAAARARLGGSAASGFAAASGLAARELARIAHAWTVAEHHGLALADLLQAARSDLMGRMRFRQRAEAGLAGARATAAVLAGLPILGVVLGQLMGASPVQVLFGGGLGGVLLVAGTVLTSAGLAWTDRIVGSVAR